MMNYWMEELALVEAAAERIQAQEDAAERMFIAARTQAEAAGQPEKVLKSQEFASWIAARHDTDAAWGRWSEVMNAKPL